MEVALTRIILFILGLHAVREVVAATGFVPRKAKHAWLVYNRFEPEIVAEALRFLGFERTSVDIAASKMKPGQTTLPERPFFQLLVLIHSNLIRFEHAVVYGRQTPVRSHFYINTMEAAHDHEQLRTMCRLLNVLILKPSRAYPDFVLTPKGGNPILGGHFAEMYNLLSLLGKGDRDASRANFDNPDNPERELINFEGYEQLLERAGEKHRIGRPLRGVAIDCNASSGSALLDIMHYFNALIEKAGTNVEPVTEAYILFRPDNIYDIDQRFKDYHYSVHRFVDLDEEAKAAIFESSISDEWKAGKRGALTQITLSLVNRGLTRTEITPNELGGGL